MNFQRAGKLVSIPDDVWRKYIQAYEIDGLIGLMDRLYQLHLTTPEWDVLRRFDRGALLIIYKLLLRAHPLRTDV